MAMEEPQTMELIGSIDSVGLKGNGITLTSLDQAGHGVSSMEKLNLTGNGSYEVVDALSFFGKKDKSPENPEASGAAADPEGKMDDGDSKGFW